MKLGINFIDTAELYGTYKHIKEAIRRSEKKPVVATKSYAYNLKGAKESLEKARSDMDLDVIDIFLLHEQESQHTLRGHREALEYFLNAKEQGLIKAVGVSTHRIEVVEACTVMPEIDVIHPLVNLKGIGIGDGTIEQMLQAVKGAFDAGKGIYSMKPLGGGNLMKSYKECMKFVLDLPFIHSVAMGMQSVDEVIMNICTFDGQAVPEEIERNLGNKQRELHVDYWCEGCGKCISKCGQGAIEIIEGKARPITEKCVLCGYCASVCPQFAIKIF
jgi:predicted aldo/keto reductase-like oxidoreductase